MKRKFYIIAHNPNKISDASKELNNGANALEPDIAFDSGEFWVYDKFMYLSLILSQQFLNFMAEATFRGYHFNTSR